MARPLVSVIIPVYNAEKYLQQCINSVITQSYHQIEVLLIDDGSIDESGKICDEYAKRDDRISVYHQENRGQAYARNMAFAKSKGEYVIYVDSDDFIGVDYINNLIELALEYDADIVQGSIKKVWNDEIELEGIFNKEIQVYSALEALEEFCYQRKFDSGPCCKLFHRKVMSKIKFPINMGYEDFAIMYQVLGTAEKIIYAPYVRYCYRQHKASTMHAAFSEKKIDRIRIASDLKKYINSFYPENNIAVNSRFLLANFQLLMDLPFEKRYSVLRKEVWSNIKVSRKIVIQDRKSKKSLQIMAFMSYLGIWPLMALGRVYKFIFAS